MRSGLVVLGVLLVLVGLVWVGQGLGYIKGSFMTDDIKWFWIGLGMAAAGVALGAVGLRRRQSNI